MVICLRSLQWSGGEVSLVGQGEKSVGGAENLTWNLKNLPSKLNFFTNEVVFYVPEPDQNFLSNFIFAATESFAGRINLGRNEIISS